MHIDALTIGKFLYELRMEKHYTQEQLAEMLNVTNKTISRYECGEGYPSLELLSKLAEIFNITVDEILKGKRNKKEEKITDKNNIVINVVLSCISILISLNGFISYFLCLYLFKMPLIGFVISLICFAINLTFFILILKKFKISSLIFLTNILYIFTFLFGFLTLFSFVYNPTFEYYQGLTINYIDLLIAICLIIPCLILSSVYLYRILKNNTAFKNSLVTYFKPVSGVAIISWSAVAILLFLIDLSSSFKINPTSIALLAISFVLLTILLVLGIISLCLKINNVLLFVCSILAILILIFSIVSFHFVFGGLSRLSFIILAFSLVNLVFAIISYRFKKRI